MTGEALCFSRDEDALQDFLFDDLKGAQVLGMGPDLWELSQNIVPRLGTAGRFVGVHTGCEAIDEARCLAGNGSQNGQGIEFHQVGNDLRLSRMAADALVQRFSPTTLGAFQALERELARVQAEEPLVADESVDLVVATGLRYLTLPAARKTMLKDFHRVVKRGGRLIVIDVVSDESISTSDLLNAVNGQSKEIGQNLAREAELVDSLAEAGFYGITLLRRDTLPWHTVGRVELRRCALAAYKGKEGPCWERFQAVMYRGPFKNVEDDDGHFYPRGQQIAVCQKTFAILSREPYRGQFEYTDPLIPVPPQMEKPFPCNLKNPVRDPQQLKFRPTVPSRPESKTGAASQAASPTDTGLKEQARTGKPCKKVIIFERSVPDPSSPIRELAASLRERSGEEWEVQIVNLEENSDVRLPAQLRFRMSLAGENCFPAIAVDGVLVALGTLPDADEAAKLVTRGRPWGALPFTNLKSLAAKAVECCDGSSSCCK